MNPGDRGFTLLGKIDLDVLSDVLRAVRLTGAIYFDVHACHPWVAETPPISSIGANVMPEFEHVIAFHIMLDGWCWAQLADESQPADATRQRRLPFSSCGAIRISCPPSPGRDQRPIMDIYYRPKDRPLPFVLNEFGGQGEKSRFVCGYLGFDSRPFNPVLGALPSMLHVKSSSVGGQLTHDLIRVALKESEKPARRQRDDPLEVERSHVPAGGTRIRRCIARRNPPDGWQRFATDMSARR